MAKTKIEKPVVLNLDELTKDTNKKIAELVEALEVFDEVKIEKLESEYGGFVYNVTVSIDQDPMAEDVFEFKLSKEHGLLQEALRLAISTGCAMITSANA